MKPSVFYKNRFRSQDKFNIVVYGERDKNMNAKNEVNEFKGPD